MVNNSTYTAILEYMQQWQPFQTKFLLPKKKKKKRERETERQREEEELCFLKLKQRTILKELESLC